MPFYPNTIIGILFNLHIFNLKFAGNARTIVIHILPDFHFFCKFNFSS